LLELQHCLFQKEEIDRVVNITQQKRDFIWSELAKIPNFPCPKPDGAFYLYPDVSAYFGYHTPKGAKIQTADDFCKYLLEDYSIVLVPGSGFGDSNGVRISYATSMELLKEGAEAITKYVTSLKK